MLDKKLNTEIRNLLKLYINTPYSYENRKMYNEYWKVIEDIIKPEFERLHNEAGNFSTLSKKSILTLIMLNRKLGVIKRHKFGLYIGDSLEQVSNLLNQRMDYKTKE